MKSFAIIGTALLFPASVTLGASAVHRGGNTPASAPEVIRVLGKVSPTHIGLQSRMLSSGPVAYQAASTTTPGVTTTPTGTATGTPAPTPGATNTYPDPVSILQKAFGLLQRITSARFVMTNDFNNGTEHFVAKSTGDVTCKNLAIKGTFTTTDTILGTSQQQKTSEQFIRVKTSTYTKSKKSKGKWAKAKGTTLDNFGVTVDNLLACPNSPANSGSGSGSGSGSDTSGQLKDLVNKGPATYQGIAVWRIGATYVSTDQSGQTTDQAYEFLVGQQHGLLYQTSLSGDDPQLGHYISTQSFSKFGEKITIKAPKVGSTTP